MKENKNLKKFKVIFKSQKKNDGSSFTKTLTILKDKNGKDLWVNIKFGDSVNTKIWKGKNQIVTAESKLLEDGTNNIRIPKSFSPYEYQGKKKYPYIFINEIVESVEYVYEGSSNNYYVDPDDIDFSLDDVTTDPISANQDKDMPF